MRERWATDPVRMPLPDRSDGGTFTYTSGLEAGSHFTYLAPVAAAFHPMPVQMADEWRLAGLPIHIVHGVQDWMFPVSLARDADQYSWAAGDDLVYREVADLGHASPFDMNGGILDWLMS